MLIKSCQFAPRPQTQAEKIDWKVGKFEKQRRYTNLTSEWT